MRTQTFFWDTRVMLPIDIRLGAVVTVLIVVLFLTLQYVIPMCSFLSVAALAVVMIMISYPLILRQEYAKISKTSPLVRKVRDNLPVGTRFAVIRPGVNVLPPNLNASLGLPSLHSYNSLSSTSYHYLINQLGGKMRTYGRWNGSIIPDYNSPVFWMSNISLLLSEHNISDVNLQYIGQEFGVKLYKVLSRMGESLQVVPLLKDKLAGTEWYIRDPRLLKTIPARKIRDQGDLLAVGVEPLSKSSVLVLSRKFYRDWYAQVYSKDCSNWNSARIMVVNKVFLGVFLPENTTKVLLSYRPYARYAWIGHIFWTLVLALWVKIGWNKAICNWSRGS